MKRSKQESCCSCRKFPLTKDEIGASKKLIDTDISEYYCIDCLAAYLEATPEDIRDKIEMFKEDGCMLFK